MDPNDEYNGADSPVVGGLAPGDTRTMVGELENPPGCANDRLPWPCRPFCEFMEWVWYRKLCPQPDKPIFGSLKVTQWLYNFTGRKAAFWHRQNCERCMERHLGEVITNPLTQESRRLNKARTKYPVK